MAAVPLEVVGEIVSAPIADIQTGDRLRPVDPVWAAALGAIMAVDGQNTPIEICRMPGKTGFLLVAGGHRLEGARFQGWETIRAVVVDANAISRRLREVSENVWRKGLDPIDRASFVAELITLNKAKAGLSGNEDGRAVSANVRWSKALKADVEDASLTMRLAYGWADDVGETIGLSRQTIYRDLELHRRLLPDVVAQLRGRPIAGNAAQLRALAKASDADQRTAVAMIVEGTAKTPTEALAILNQKPVLDPDQKAWSAFFGGWSRMSAAKRRLALKELAEQGLPRGVTITFEGDAA
jgi:hypothetical protein